MSNEEVVKEVTDFVYRCYVVENDMDCLRYGHPMFYNGTFSKNNECQPPKPEPLMEKEEFIQMISKGDTEWSKAMDVLGMYILNQNKDD